MKQRASAVIVKDGKLLLIKRVKPYAVYHTLPGGKVEEGETAEQGMIREIKEELSVDAKIGRLLFKLDFPDREDYHFLIESISGEPKVGGPEAERMNQDNQYILEWIPLAELSKLETFSPSPAGTKEKLIEMLR